MRLTLNYTVIMSINSEDKLHTNIIVRNLYISNRNTKYT